MSTQQLKMSSNLPFVLSVCFLITSYPFLLLRLKPLQFQQNKNPFFFTLTLIFAVFSFLLTQNFEGARGIASQAFLLMDFVYQPNPAPTLFLALLKASKPGRR